MAFFIEWRALDRADRLVRERRAALDGRLLEVLRPAAEALQEKFPEAASLLYRRVIESVLDRGASKQYHYAARDLMTCTRLVPHLPKPGSIESHAGFVARLRKTWTEIRVLGVDRIEGALRMARRTTPPTASDDQVRALLERYHCRVPFHAVRTRLLGNIASPAMQGSPIRMVEGLWGGELPTFDSIDDANELIGALVTGLWNRLTRHQERSAPFRLTRMEVPATREGMTALARQRREELEGFVEGLFGDEERVDLPERAHKALDALAENPRIPQCRGRVRRPAGERRAGTAISSPSSATRPRSVPARGSPRPARGSTTAATVSRVKRQTVPATPLKTSS